MSDRPSAARTRASLGRSLGFALFVSQGLALAQSPPAAPAAPDPAASGVAAESALPAVHVRGRDELDGTTEHSGSYTTRAITIGGTPQSLRETPQSVSVVTRERLDDQNATTLAEAMRGTTGMKVTPYGTGTDGIEARGYDLSSWQLDGTPVASGSGSWSSSFFDLALFDRVEVWRGPAGLLQGMGDPGGTVNLVRKRARATPGLQVNALVGSWDRYRAEADATGPLNDDASLRGRAVLAYERRDYFTDHAWSRKPVLYGTLEYDLRPGSTVSVGVVRQEGTHRPFYGVSQFADGRLGGIPRSTFLGADWQRKRESLTMVFAELEQALGAGAQLKLVARTLGRKSRTEHQAWGDSYIDPVTGNVLMTPMGMASDERDRSVAAQLVVPLSWWGREHQLLVGASHDRHKGGSTYNGSNYGEGAVLQNIYAPDIDLPKPDLPLDPMPRTRVEQSAVYGQLRLRPFDGITLLAGGRLGWWKQTDPDAPATDQSIKARFVPYVGLVGDLSADWSAYGSFSSIYAPQLFSQTITGGPLPPRKGEQIELGVKGAHFGDRLHSQLALFRIRDTGRAITDPADPTEMASIAAGEVVSKGAEAELSGELAPGWELTAGYAYTSTRYAKAPPGQQGTPFTTEFPRHNVNLWTKRRMGGALDRLWLGGGLRYLSKSSVTDGDMRWEQGGYTVASVQAGWRFSPRLEASLTVDNLTDKYYYERFGWTRQVYFGSPRSVTASLHYRY